MTHMSVPSFWRLNRSKYRLVGYKCKACGKVGFPPRTVCSGCGSDKIEEKALPDSGQILTWSVIHVAPDGFEAPYTVGIVKLEDGTAVSSQIVGDMSKLSVGARVRAVFRRLGETDDGLLLYGFKFELE
jgi:uncharacterized OB-fold protein